MAHYGVNYRGRRLDIDTRVDARNGDVHCTVAIDGQDSPNLRGNPFRNEATAQATGAAFARAVIDAELDGDVLECLGYFIRTNSSEQRDGSWVGGYQFHRNDNPVPFRRATCPEFRANTRVEAEDYALGVARQALEADVAAGKL